MAVQGHRSLSKMNLKDKIKVIVRTFFTSPEVAYLFV